MAQINFDATQVDPTSTFDTFPVGEYLMCVVKSDIKQTKAGTGLMLEYEADVLEGQYQGRKVFGRMNIQNPNPQAQEIGRRELSQLCHAVGVLQVQDSVELHNKPFVGKVGIEKDKTGQYDDKNVIKQFKPVQQGQVGTGLGAPAPAPAPGAVGAAPATPMQQPAPAQGVGDTGAPPAPAVGDKPAWAQ